MSEKPAHRYGEPSEPGAEARPPVDSAALLHRMGALLVRCEWAGAAYDQDACPVCQAAPPKEAEVTHSAADCELRAALDDFQRWKSEQSQ